jgi:hypothetical protein
LLNGALRFSPAGAARALQRKKTVPLRRKTC